MPGRTLLHPLDFSFPPGQVCGLIGHNGSGKSTLLKILGRHQPGNGGEARLNDRPLAEWDNKAFVRQVAYLPQQLPAAEGMTVRELVALGRYPWHGALGRFSIADRLVDSLSSGAQQHAWLAMTMAQDSRCLLLDELTLALDIAYRRQCGRTVAGRAAHRGGRIAASRAVFALGITPIAVADIVFYRQWVQQPVLPPEVIDVGERVTPNLELMAVLQPDMILYSAGYGPACGAAEGRRARDGIAYTDAAENRWIWRASPLWRWREGSIARPSARRI